MFQQLDIAIGFVVVMLLLSLLVTAIVQAISAVFDLRGKNLLRALSDLLKQIDPGLNAPAPRDTKLTPPRLWLNKIRDVFVHPFSFWKITLATRAADAITQHPVIAHTFTRAKSIRKDELLDVLKDLCSADTIASIDPAAKAKLEQMLAAEVPGGAATADVAQRLAIQLGDKFPGLKEQLGEVLTETMGSISRVEEGIAKWFDAVMDRASDVFTRWTRAITIAISVLLVVILQIDAGLILKQISTNPDIRAGLLKLSDTALTQADEALKIANRGTNALNAIADKHSGDATLAGLKNAPPLSSCQEGKQWLEQYGKNKPADTANLQKEFDAVCDPQAAADLKNSVERISQLQKKLEETNLKIVPDKIGDTLVFGNEKTPFRDRVRSWWKAYLSSGAHLLGTLAMVVLLSLGAPFWYNALKQLSNLKPSVTQKIEKESASA
jgi:hypothetical protein